MKSGHGDCTRRGGDSELAWERVIQSPPRVLQLAPPPHNDVHGILDVYSCSQLSFHFLDSIGRVHPSQEQRDNPCDALRSSNEIRSRQCVMEARVIMKCVTILIYCTYLTDLHTT